MNAGTFTVASGVASCVLGVAGAAVLLAAPSSVGVPVMAVTACGVAILCWPWLALPAAIIGAPVVATALGITDPGAALAIQAGILGIGGLAILIRRVLAPGAGADGRVRTPADIPMLALAAVALVGGCYSLARGNPAGAVLSATYQVAVIPACFFLACYSLNTTRRLRAAGLVYVAVTAAVAAVELIPPRRHLGVEIGMLLATAMVPVLATAFRTTGWRRIGLIVLLAAQAAGVIVAGPLPVWTAASVAVVVLLVRGMPKVRIVVCCLVVVGAVAFLGAAAANPHVLDDMSAAANRVAPLSTELFGPGSGAAVDVFMANPVIGGALGQPAVAFWPWLLAGLGGVGVIAVLLPLVFVLRPGLAPRRGYALAFTALAIGCYAGPLVVGPGPVPTTAHWELGLLPALALVAARLPVTAWSSARRPVPSTNSGRHRAIAAGPWATVVRAALPAGPSVSGGRHR